LAAQSEGVCLDTKAHAHAALGAKVASGLEKELNLSTRSSHRSRDLEKPDEVVQPLGRTLGTHQARLPYQPSPRVARKSWTILLSHCILSTNDLEAHVRLVIRLEERVAL